MAWSSHTTGAEAEEYQDHFHRTPGGRYIHTSEQRAVRELEAGIPSGDGLRLDAGCGPGRFASRINGRRTIGIDISLEMIRLARQRDSDTQYIVGDLDNLPFRPGVFEEVVCVRVLQHLQNQQELLRQFRRVTKAGGHLTLLCYNRLSALSVYRGFRMSKIARIVGYGWILSYDRYSSERELRYLVREAGFLPEQAIGAISGPPWLLEYFPILSWLEHTFPKVAAAWWWGWSVVDRAFGKTWVGKGLMTMIGLRARATDTS